MSASKRALVVGIDEYDSFPPLAGAATDADSIAALLRRHENGGVNYNCQVLTSSTSVRLDRDTLRRALRELFASFREPVLFYFAGHGHASEVGGHISTCDGTRESPGLAMSDIVTMANQSKAAEVLVILDCCHSGALGNGPCDESVGSLREGVTLLAASRPSQRAKETIRGGVFTELLIDGLRGGAADLRGHVTAAGLYAYADQALDAWAQRPIYKSYSSTFSVIRHCLPLVSDEILRAIIELFPDEDSELMLDRSYEHSCLEATPENVERFQKLKILRNGGLVESTRHADLYYSAVNGGGAKLTPWGRRYWRMIKNSVI